MVHKWIKLHGIPQRKPLVYLQSFVCSVKLTPFVLHFRAAATTVPPFIAVQNLFPFLVRCLVVGRLTDTVGSIAFLRHWLLTRRRLWCSVASSCCFVGLSWHCLWRWDSFDKINLCSIRIAGTHGIVTFSPSYNSYLAICSQHLSYMWFKPNFNQLNASVKFKTKRKKMNHRGNLFLFRSCCRIRSRLIWFLPYY